MHGTQVELLWITPNAEQLIELCGRICYQSEDKITDNSYEAFIRRLISKGYESVLEHAVACVRITQISRVLTHQLVRHRIASYSQKSQRYVSEDGFRVKVPVGIGNDSNKRQVFMSAIDSARSSYKKLVNMGLPKEAAKYVLPNATETEIIMTANMRQWRHIFKLRGHPSAQDEIRRAVIKIYRILKQYCPNVFYDFELNPRGDIIKYDGV